jgi:hypothetical protein
MPVNNSLALMREATRIVEAEFQGAMLVQMNKNATEEETSGLRFWFSTDLSNVPNVKTATIAYSNETWTIIQTFSQSIIFAKINDLLRIEIDLDGAVGYIRASGYSGPLFFQALLQPVDEPTPPNPFYYFSPSLESEDTILVDAVTGQVSWQQSSQSRIRESPIAIES